jgi:hypothetical protein
MVQEINRPGQLREKTDLGQEGKILAFGHVQAIQAGAGHKVKEETVRSRLVTDGDRLHAPQHRQSGVADLRQQVDGLGLTIWRTGLITS